jgi:hypothetical protein
MNEIVRMGDGTPTFPFIPHHAHYYLRPSPSSLPESPIDGAQISIGRPRGRERHCRGFLPCRVSDASRSSAWHPLSWAGMISCSLFVRVSVF